MPEAPQTYTVKAVTPDCKKVMLSSISSELDLVPQKGEQRPTLTPGDEVKGWVNLQGQYGPYLKLARANTNGAQSRPAGSSQPARDDATGRSIERQVAAKIAGEIMCARLSPGDALPQAARAVLAEEFHFLVDTIHDAIKGSTPDEQIPFG